MVYNVQKRNVSFCRALFTTIENWANHRIEGFFFFFLFSVNTMENFYQPGGYICVSLKPDKNQNAPLLVVILNFNGFSLFFFFLSWQGHLFSNSTAQIFFLSAFLFFTFDFSAFLFCSDLILDFSSVRIQASFSLIIFSLTFLAYSLLHLVDVVSFIFPLIIITFFFFNFSSLHVLKLRLNKRKSMVNP